MTALLTIKDLKVYYPIKTGILNRTTDHIKAVDGVDLVIEAGKTYGIIGESGSGKIYDRKDDRRTRTSDLG